MNQFVSYFAQLQVKWRLLLGGLLVVLGCLFLGTLPASVFLNQFTKVKGWDLVQFKKELMLNPNLANLYLFFNLVPYICAFAAIWFVYKFYLRGNLFTSIRPSGKWRWKRLIIPGLMWVSLSLVFDFYEIIQQPELYQFYFNPSSFLPLLLIGLLILPIQTSFEELFFRGYLLNATSVLSKNIWIGVIVSSVLFGLMHSFNPEIDKYGFLNMMPFYMFFGLVLALITIWDEGLEIALSLHYFNNLYTLLIVSMEGSALQVRPLFLRQEADILSMRWSFMMGLLFILLIVVFVFKLKWPIKWRYEKKNN